MCILYTTVVGSNSQGFIHQDFTKFRNTLCQKTSSVLYLLFFPCFLQGGMKAVLWTNAFQMVVLFGCLMTLIVKGSIDAGGLNTVWRTADEGGRLNVTQ